ncbi:hypothetical protein OW763_14450 [Clostridium aestuarii]|uniref:DUF5673 domain-containing protein n=1 Tax=Clostridium aestuarii TaxID=338193 RepID=A0ABT4D332_9CLOT|nr:hypothetical protein [Clostridium aestuarii]MCY6485532.1 hypothetical protein [Clostridium aestuarii]
MGILINIVIQLFFIAIIIQRLRRIKEIIIPIRKKYIQIIIALIVFISITYFYANTWINYVTGILAILMFVSMWLAQGIISKGFISMYKCKEIISWNEIEKVMVISSKDIKVKVSEGFMQQIFYFKKSDYDKVITILKENLPKQAKLQTILNK